MFFNVLTGVVSVWHCVADYRGSLNQVVQSARGPWGRECDGIAIGQKRSWGRGAPPARAAGWPPSYRVSYPHILPLTRICHRINPPAAQHWPIQMDTSGDNNGEVVLCGLPEFPYP